MSENKFYNKPEYLVEEAKNTIKIGRRRAIDSINLIDGFFQEGRQDQSEIRDGIYQLCQGIELIVKGLIKFYGEEYVNGHETQQNGSVLDSINVPEVRKELRDVITVLQDKMFSYNFTFYCNVARYRNFKFDNNFLKDGQRVRDTLIKFVDVYILE